MNDWLYNKLNGIQIKGLWHRRYYVHGERVTLRTLIRLLRYKTDNYLSIDGWIFSMPYGVMYLDEHRSWGDYLPDWIDEYPYDGLRGIKVLDVGAGCGETAKFFIDNGASHVYTVEPDRMCLTYLTWNAEKFKDKLTVISRKDFNPSILKEVRFNLLKMDIEGYEIIFADWLKENDYNIDIVLEVHSVYMRDRFIRLGFKERKTDTLEQPYGFPTRIMYRWMK